MQLGNRVDAIERRVAAIEDLLAALSLSVADLAEAAGIVEPPVVQPDEEAAPAPVVVPAAAAPAPTRQAVRNLYVVTAAPAAAHGLLGVWVCTWNQLASRLPGGRLFGSGVELKRVRDEAAAAERWVEEGWNLPVPRHEVQ